MRNQWQSTTCDVVYPTKGIVRPCTFIWAGDRLRITDIGRCWQDEDGTHRLVRVQDGRTFELWEAQGQWQARLVASPPSIV